jgi:hypothetical protein
MSWTPETFGSSPKLRLANQFEEDFRRMQASCARLSAAVEMFKLAQEDVEAVCHRVVQAGLKFHWDDIFTRRRNASKRTTLYKRALPVLTNHYNACREAGPHPHADGFRGGPQVAGGGYDWWTGYLVGEHIF